jgi:hypothetical protein
MRTDPTGLAGRWSRQVPARGPCHLTEVFDCGPEENRQHLLREGGGWINGTNSVLESMTSSLERLEKISTK